MSETMAMVATIVIALLSFVLILGLWWIFDQMTIIKDYKQTLIKLEAEKHYNEIDTNIVANTLIELSRQLKNKNEIAIRYKDRLQTIQRILDNGFIYDSGNDSSLYFKDNLQANSPILSEDNCVLRIAQRSMQTKNLKTKRARAKKEVKDVVE